MEIVKTKGLEEEIHEVEVLGVKSTFYGGIAGFISNQNGRGFNVLIASKLEKMNHETYVFPIMVPIERAKKLYDRLK